MADFSTVDAGLPCLNPSCKSHGLPHPNCKCYQHAGFAHGGSVHYCAHGMPHMPECEHFADGGEVEQNQSFNQNPGLAIDHAVANHGLLHLLTKTGHSKSEDPHRGAQEFMDHAKRGQAKTEAHSKSQFEKKMPDSEVDPHGVEALKTHLEDLHANPDKMFSIGGNLSSSLPDHAGMLAAKAANATSYLHSLKPMGTQLTPFDKVMNPSPMEETVYNRQLQIAQQPLSILPKVKNGTVSPKDLQTLQTLYPQLGQSILDKTFEGVAAAHENKTTLPYKHKMGLSALMGPLDSTQTPQAMQAIIASAAGNTETSSQQKPEKKSRGGQPTAATQKTIEKTDRLYETPLDSLEINKKD